MQFKVRFILEDSVIAPSELKKLTISNTMVDKIINAVVERENRQYIQVPETKPKKRVTHSR